MQQTIVNTTNTTTNTTGTTILTIIILRWCSRQSTTNWIQLRYLCNLLSHWCNYLWHINLCTVTELECKYVTSIIENNEGKFWWNFLRPESIKNWFIFKTDLDHTLHIKPDQNHRFHYYQQHMSQKSEQIFVNVRQDTHDYYSEWPRQHLGYKQDHIITVLQVSGSISRCWNYVLHWMLDRLWSTQSLLRLSPSCTFGASTINFTCMRHIMHRWQEEHPACKRDMVLVCWW